MKLSGAYMVAVLLIGSVYDWKYFSLPVWLLAVSVLGGICGVMYSLFWEDATLFSVGMAFLPGVSALLLSYITREQIGYGDGILLLAMGGSMGLEAVIVAVGIALAASFVVSVTLVVLKKVGRAQKLPFVPFLFLGSIITWGGGLLFG